MSRDSDEDEDQFQFIDTIDTILPGTATYRMFADYWPKAITDTEIIADKLNATPKLVFSKTLEQAPWGKWEEITIIKTDAAKEIARLKQQSGKNMVLWGSISLAQSLIKEELINEFQLRICPSVLGSGKSLFPDIFSIPDIKLIETKQYQAGVALLRYELG